MRAPLNGRLPAAAAQAAWRGNSSRMWPARRESSSRPNSEGPALLPGPRLQRILRSLVRCGCGSQELQWVHGGCTFANFKVQLRAGNGTGLAGLGNDIAALDNVATFHKQFLGMGIGRDPAAFMADEDEVAVTLQFVAGIGHDSAFSGAHARALRHGN